MLFTRFAKPSKVVRTRARVEATQTTENKECELLVKTLRPKTVLLKIPFNLNVLDAVFVHYPLL